MILDPYFPRAIRHRVHAASDALDKIIDMLDVNVPAQGEMEKLKAMLEETDIDKILSNGLHEFVDVFQFNLNVVDESLYRSFFALDEKSLATN